MLFQPNSHLNKDLQELKSWKQIPLNFTASRHTQVNEISDNSLVIKVGCKLMRPFHLLLHNVSLELIFGSLISECQQV